MSHEARWKSNAPHHRLSGRNAASLGRWENEGGASVNGPTASGIAPSSAEAAHQDPAPGGVSVALDNLQDEMMAGASSDGRPPSHRQRVVGWRWFGIGAILLIGAAAVWISIERVSFGAIAIGVTLGALLLLLGASPILGAGWMRGREERAARKSARMQLQTVRSR